MYPSQNPILSPPGPSDTRTINNAPPRPSPSRPSSFLLPLPLASGLQPPPHPSSIAPTIHGYQQHVAADHQPTYSRPEIRPPSGSKRSLSSSTTGARVVGGDIPFDAEEVGLSFDQYVDGGGGDSGKSMAGSVGDFFADDLQLEGVGRPTPPPSAPSSRPHLSLPPPSYPSYSTPTLPSPLSHSYTNDPDPHRCDSSGWLSEYPFAAGTHAPRAEENGKDSTSTPVAGFKLIRSAEETRTSQACQACRSRKSKCDGSAPCIRCENRGISCVYIARFPRYRGSASKHGSEAVRPPTPSLLASCFTTDPLVYPPVSSPAFGYPNLGRGVSRSRRRGSDREWGVVVGSREFVRSHDEPQSFSAGGGGSRRNSIGSGSLSVEAAARGSEESRRRQPSTDPYPSPHVSIPIGSSYQPSPPSFSHSQSYPTPRAYSTFPSGESQSFQSPPPPQQMHRRLVSEIRPHFSPCYPPPLSEHQSHSLGSHYPFVALPTSLHQHGSTPPLDHHSLLLGQPSDGSTSFAVGLSARNPPTFYNLPPEPYQSQRIHPEVRRSSFPSVQAPSSSSGSRERPAAAREPGAVVFSFGENWADEI